MTGQNRHHWPDFFSKRTFFEVLVNNLMVFKKSDLGLEKSVLGLDLTGYGLEKIGYLGLATYAAFTLSGFDD